MLREVLGLTSGELYDGVKLTITNRLKRDRRIIERLRRGTELDRMQDLVGFRIVGSFSLSQQDDLTREIARHFARDRDRRLLEDATDARSGDRRNVLLSRRLEVGAEWSERATAAQAAVEDYGRLLEEIQATEGPPDATGR